MNKLLIFGVLFAFAIALATAPSAMAADTLTGNASGTTNMSIWANSSALKIDFLGCQQMLPNSTNPIKLAIDSQTIMNKQGNDTQVQYNCTWSFLSAGVLNITRITIPLPSNDTNLSTIVLYNWTNTSTDYTGNRPISLQHTWPSTGGDAILANFTFTDVDFFPMLQTTYFSFLFYTNTTTIGWNSLTQKGDTWEEKYTINHPSAGGIGFGIADLNLTICPTYKTGFKSDGSLIRVEYNGTTQTFTTTSDGYCVNRTADVNSTYAVTFIYRTTAVTTSSSEQGSSASAPAAITPTEAVAGIINIVIIVIFVALIVGLSGFAVYLYNKKR